MDIVDPAIDRYLHEWANPRDPVLREMEVLAAERNFPIVGPQVGRLLLLLARTMGARRIIELGSGFGYSAYWFARAVGSSGMVIMTEGSEEQAEEAQAYLERGGFKDRVEILVGDGLEIIDALGGPFDIIFNDVDKEQYPQVLDKAIATLRPGGLLISDNMLWFGSVLDEKPDQETARAVKELTRMLFESDRFDTSLIPIRDGVMVSRFKG